LTNTNGQKINSTDEYFAANEKFFNAGDSNAKKAFFMLGQYTKKVMECVEKQVAETGGENAFQAKITRLAMSNMTYRVFSQLVKLLDDTSLKCNSKLFFSCSGQCKQYIIQSDLPNDKRALPIEDGNTAFSLGLYQKL
jgi:hypothetical protein